MKDIHKFLVDWTKTYVKHQDAVNKSIEDIKKSKEFDLIVKHKTKEEFYIIEPFIKDDTILNKLTKDKIITLVVFNSKENFNFIIDNWKRFIDLTNFKIIFVNPFSEIDKKWILKPYIHNKICDESSLKLGLKSMFDMVTPINEKVIKEETTKPKRI